MPKNSIRGAYVKVCDCSYIGTELGPFAMLPPASAYCPTCGRAYAVCTAEHA